MRRSFSAILMMTSVVLLSPAIGRAQVSPTDVAPPSSVSGGTIQIEPPKLSPAENAALDKLESFYVTVGDKKAMQDLRNMRATNSIRFVDSKSSEENASYYGGFISLPKSFIKNVEDDSETDPRKKEITWRMHFGTIADVGQSLVHEMNHAAHDRGEDRATFINVDKTLSAMHPYGSHFESIAYEDALKRTEQWMTNLQDKLSTEDGRTRENATMLSMLAKTWGGYNNDVFGEAGKSILWNPQGDGTSYWTDASGKPIPMHEKRTQIEKVGAEAEKIQAACEMLESLPDALMMSMPKGTTFEQLMDLLAQNVRDEKTLKEMVEKMASLAAAMGRGTAVGKLNADPAKNVPGIESAGYSILFEQWKSRRRKVERDFDATIRDLTGAPLRLTYTPNPAVFDPAAGKGAVTVNVADNATDKAQTKLAFLVRSLTGMAPNIRIVDYWTTPTEKDQPFDYPAGATRSFDFPKPEEQKITVRRVVIVGVAASQALPANSPVRQRVERTASETVQFKIDIPTEIGGKWVGSLTINTLNYHRDNEQGCAILDNLKGKPLGASVVLSPKDVASGRMELTVAAPNGSGAVPGEAAVLAYRNVNGAFSATGAQGNGKMTLNGGFRQEANRWQLGGTWTWSGKGASATGVWSTSNPNAR